MNDSTNLGNLRGQQAAKTNPVASLNHYFTAHRKQLAAALPKHLNPDRMARLALTAFSQNAALAKCDPKTIFSSVIIASQLGLEIGVLGQAYLVPYKTTCTLIPGWQGYVDLVSRTGRGTVWTGAVFEGDRFEYQMGDAPSLKHWPGDEDDPDLITHVYAVGRVNGAEWPIIEVWSIKKIWKHRDKNNNVGKNHYSYKHPEMYARKIPLMQVIKYMPKSVELSSALDVDVAATKGHGSEYIDGDFVTVDNGESGAPAAQESQEIENENELEKPYNENANQKQEARTEPVRQTQKPEPAVQTAQRQATRPTRSRAPLE